MSGNIDVTDYLLGELEPEDQARAERLEREDPEFRREVERLRPVVSNLEGLPSEVWEIDEVRTPVVLPGVEAAESARAPERRRRLLPRLTLGSRLRLPLPAAAAAAGVLLALGVAIGMLVGGPGDEDAAPGQVIALEPLPGAPEGAGGEARVIYGDDGRAELEVSGLEPTGDGDFYELWLLNGPDDLVSLGSFRVGASGEARLDVPVPADGGQFGFLDISREPDDGDPSHSGDSVLRAPA